MHHTGNLFIQTLDDAARFSAVVFVDGCLSVSVPAVFPFLTEVRGALRIAAHFEAPSLASVGGYISVHSAVTLPALVSVGEGLFITAKTVYPVLKSAAGLPLPDPGLARQRIVELARFVLERPERLDMCRLDRSVNKDCLLGWTIILFGQRSLIEFIKEYDIAAVGTHLLGIDCQPLFFLDNDAALATLRAIAGMPYTQ